MTLFKKALFCFLLLCTLGQNSRAEGIPENVHTLFEDLRLRTLRYFIDHRHPKTGLVRDRARNHGPTPDTALYRMASVASTGFGYAVMAHAAQTGRLDSQFAYQKITESLQFVKLNLQHHHGWLYHFIDWETGQRFGNSEVSTIDSALFIAGALYAAHVYPNTELANLTQELYLRMNFPVMLTDGGLSPQRLTLAMGWTPEGGYLPYRWDAYAEHLILILLGLGHPTKPLPPECWTAFSRTPQKDPSGAVVYGSDLPLFIHQYSHAFVDFRDFHDRYGNYFRNSILATKENERISRNDPSLRTYREGFWGLSASGSSSGYYAFSPAFHNGTVCPGCMAASAMFLPLEIGQELVELQKSPYFSRFWGLYSYTDSLNIDQNWFDGDVIGITVGALYLALANLEKESIWLRYNSIPEIKKALAIAQQIAPELPQVLVVPQPLGKLE